MIESNFEKKIFLGKNKFLKKKIRLFEDETNFGFFSYVTPGVLKGSLKKSAHSVQPFGQL